MPRDSTPHAAVAERPSLALPFVFERLRRRRGLGVLDLGPADGVNLQTFAALDCRLHVTDLYRGLASRGAGTSDDPARFAEACATLLPEAGAEPYDIVLAWDVFDYLEREQLAALMRLVSGCLRPGALLFCIVSIHAQIAPRPLAYRILAPDLLAATGEHQASRPGPRHHQPVLLRAMPRFEVEKSFLLRHGAQEYLFSYRCERDEAGGEDSEAGEPSS